MSEDKIKAIQVISPEEIKGFFGPYRWLSNFHLCVIRYEGVDYPSVENAYMAAKTVAHSIREKFVGITPAEARKLGQTIPLREDWEGIKSHIMKQLLEEKFSHEDLKEKLLLTGGRYLEETNWWGDRYWGVCDGEGKNILGQLLMIIRDDLKSQL